MGIEFTNMTKSSFDVNQRRPGISATDGSLYSKKKNMWTNLAQAVLGVERLDYR